MDCEGFMMTISVSIIDLESCCICTMTQFYTRRIAPGKCMSCNIPVGGPLFVCRMTCEIYGTGFCTDTGEGIIFE